MEPQAPDAVTGNPKQQVADRLAKANSILVTVSNNPTVDQLAACIGFTILLNKLGKHATAVFSGQIPSTVEFLQPEKTIKKNTDSLRDFIIALDKSKADKLRYKIEDKYVKIFITPYKSAISEKDLNFSQGDVNVDVIVALGVHKRDELDGAITAHGRILHDATVISVTTGSTSDIGAINWNEAGASSLCEILTDLGETLKPGLLDAQISTALLTGVVAETNRFSNAKTSAQTMSLSAKLINAGANQQLVATKLEPPEPPAPKPAPLPDKPKNSGGDPAGVPAELPRPTSGSLSIPHDEDKKNHLHIEPENSVATGAFETEVEQINIDEEGKLQREAELAKERASQANLALPNPGPAAAHVPATKPVEPTGILPTQTPPPISTIGTSSSTQPISNEIEAVRRSVSNALDNTSAAPGSGMSYEDMVPKDVVDPEDQPSGLPRSRPSDPLAPPPVPPPLMPGSGTSL